ncbi:MAG TPA: xanthine dehydrogenase family protein molybdopterin-binding subunit [Alphaproteobacteria bacterium]|jgi:CO/xanthine dehydrogenase Mo-binding subunit|nr:xanthine dehydrogenase family protein molybdopterin-binding subunit [Alphaproteobacteria bacterium]MDP7427896.1 xanthine dehydrogenase family protein molybdopterin-binding subunit [Alphaproteobacteria bacterium]HJM48561.1 xanthine dehydrogenase family protein molybdopterin-binding subunit [Alphaproteobacteria bacterium]
MNDAAHGEYKWIGTRPPRPDGVDKVTGRAKFGADTALPNMLVGAVLRSPHAHAKIKSIDISKAEALPGVKAVVSRDDFQDMPSEMVPAGEMMVNYRDMVRNVMAREKVLYDGHAVAAVAATSASVARRALKLIEVDYEVLPHVIDVMAAMKPDAPLLHDDIFTEGVEPVPDKASNVAKRIEIGFGDMAAGFEAAAEVIEREFDTQPVHQGYIEPHACLADVSEDGQAELFCSTQGQYLVRAHCARLLGMDVSRLRVTASEIGGGFGGKTVVYIEPVALALSRKACRPVKLVMSRDEVFRASGPTSGAHVRIKLGAAKDGTITAAEAELFYQAGAFPGSSVQPAAMCAFAPYALEAVNVVGWDVVSNRPKISAYRAPGAPISVYAVECVLDEMAARLGLDPVDFRLKNAAKEGTKAAYGPKFGPIGMIESLEAAKAHAHYQAPLGPNQGRGVASGFWFNIGGETCVSLNLNEDGTLNLLVGTPDIGGSRASMAMMAAEELGVDMADIQTMIGDTGSLGFNFLSAGSRTTFSTGMATVEAARTVIEELRRRAAKIWEIDVDAVVWEQGSAKPAGSNAGEFEPLSIAELAKQAGATGGPIAGHAEINAQGAGPSLGTQIVDVEVDPETGGITVLRHTVIQDAGKAIHPAYVEGQYQGGAAQCIGWALNEEYVYGEDGRLQNPGFLDYRIPVASDLPMIDTVIIEVPNPSHPYGVRGVGETPIIPGIAAVANAVSGALGIRLSQIPMSPPRVLKAIEEAG